MSKVQLTYGGVSRIIEGPELGLLVLSGLTRARQITTVCDRHMKYKLGLRTGKKPITERSLPEVLYSVGPMTTDKHYEVLFNSVADGQYKTLLVNRDDLALTPIHASDATLLAHVTKSNIFMEEHLFKRWSAGSSVSQSGTALPLNASSFKMLYHASERAIEDENYELTSTLRDEVKNRAKKP